MAEQRGSDVPIETALASYLALLEDAPAERLQVRIGLPDVAELTGELPIFVADDPDIPIGDPWADGDAQDPVDPWAHYESTAPVVPDMAEPDRAETDEKSDEGPE